MGIFLPRWKLLSASASAALLILTACNDPIVFTSQSATVSNPASGFTWHGPYPLDLGDVRNSNDFTPGDFYQNSTALLPSNTTAFFNSLTGQSFGPVSVTSNAVIGTLATSLFDGAHFRPFGRVYNPFSSGGSGWAPYGPQATFLDPSSSADGLFIAQGLSPTGAGLVVFADGAAPANTLDAALTGSNTWHGLLAQPGTQLALQPTVPGQGFVNTVNSFPGFYSNGASSAVGWDQGGHAFYSYVDQTDPIHLIGYLTDYNAFTQWNGGSGLRLGPLVAQNQLVSDGYGVTALWTGEDTFHAATGFRTLSLGAAHGCALNSASQAYCWGDNSVDQIGNSSEAVNAGTFPAALNLNGNVTSIAAGFEHSCAITEAGSALCWGSNGSGELGIGTITTQEPTPHAVISLPGTPTQIAAGNVHTCALVSGSVFCWGDDSDAQLGNPAYDAIFAPATPDALTAPTGPDNVTGVTTAVEIAVGEFHACARLSNGTVSCWGDNSTDEIGNGGPDTTPATSAAATSVSGLANVTQLSASSGGQYTCAIVGLVQATNHVFCWGDNSGDQLGSSTNAAPGVLMASTPVQVSDGSGALTGVVQIAAGFNHVCALLVSGAVQCWGTNAVGELGSSAPLGVATTTRFTVPLPASLTITSIAAGFEVSCAITSQNTVLCWGNNSTSQINGNDFLAGDIFEAAPIELAASANQAVHSLWSANPGAVFPTLSTGDVKSLASATDGQGNVLAIYLQADPGFVTAPSGTVTASYPIRNNNIRVYASSRGASGVWTGPTRIDDGAQFSEATTTTYQEAWGRSTGGSLSTVTGGIEYFTPGIAYLGGGRFLAAFAMTDLVQSTSSIYVRGYTVGNGWDPSAQTFQLDSMTFTQRTTTEAYRYANDIALVGDGQGDAMLMAQVVVWSGDGSNVTLRNFAMKAFTYSEAGGGWTQGFLIPNSICRANTTIPLPPFNNFCWGLKPQGMIFPGGEAAVVFPAPDGSTYSVTQPEATNLRLFTTEFHL